MGKVMTEKYHSGSNDDFFVDMITELQGAETTQKTTHINKIAEKYTVKKKRAKEGKNRADDQCDYSDTNDSPQFEKRQKLQCKITSAEYNSLFSNSI
jgi:hypothetical protein